jgi:hypothetical protein
VRFFTATLVHFTEQLQDNTRYAFLQMDDRVLVYRGADQPDMSVISPEADVWQHIKVHDPVLRRIAATNCKADTPKIPCEQLANKIFLAEFRWKIGGYCW